MKEKMVSDKDWREFFRICTEWLGQGDQLASKSASWCAWTTYRRISEDFGYWACGLPAIDDIGETGIGDGGVWGQPFNYSELAHMIIPRSFYWEANVDGRFERGLRSQDIDELSSRLAAAGFQHRLTDLILEIKLY